MNRTRLGTAVHFARNEIKYEKGRENGLFHRALIYYTQDLKVYQGTRDQPMPGPFPAPPIFLREKPRGRG